MTAALLGLALLALAACGHDRTEVEEAGQAVLRIYVFAPDKPVRTRANTDYVGATEAEKAIHSLQIWVFEHESGELVGYLRPTEVATLNANGQDSYLLAVSDDFAQRKPSVDVYVLANCSAANCGHTYGSATTRGELDAAQIANETASEGSDHFGLTALQGSVGAEEGLPMSGVLKEQPIYGESPVLRVGTEASLATVRLVRAVSKLRFVFGKSEDAEEDFRILGITLDAAVLPTAQYLLLDTPYSTAREYRISPLTGRTDADYEASATLVGSLGLVQQGVADPTVYAYAGQGAQEYETLIDGAVSSNALLSGGLFYLRESDRKLAGTIRYQIGENAPAEARFSMADAGDFSRNHTWIVYAYYQSGDFLTLATVYVKPWDEDNIDYPVYNW